MIKYLHIEGQAEVLMLECDFKRLELLLELAAYSRSMRTEQGAKNQNQNLWLVTDSELGLFHPCFPTTYPGKTFYDLTKLNNK